MKIYVAAPWTHGGDALRIAETLKLNGYTITSRWLARAHNTDPNYDYAKDPAYTAKIGKAEALKDLEDVARSDVVLVYNPVKSEGKAVEQGVALALKIPIIVIGAVTNTFQYLDPPAVTVVNTLDDALQLLKGK